VIFCYDYFEVLEKLLAPIGNALNIHVLQNMRLSLTRIILNFAGFIGCQRVKCFSFTSGLSHFIKEKEVE
jgi:hypothetical protein